MCDSKTKRFLNLTGKCFGTQNSNLGIVLDKFCASIGRNTLTVGVERKGPNIVFQEDSTTFVPSGWTLSVDDDFTLILRKLDTGNG